MHTIGALAILILASAGPAALAAQAAWLPPPVEEGLTEQLEQRLMKAGPGVQPDSLSPLDRARKTVRGLGGYLGSWKDQVAVDRAPSFPQLKVPAANQPHLDAMGRYQLCTMELFLRFESGADPGLRRSAALGLTAFTMAVLRLRQPFISAGGNDERMEAFLTSPPLGALFEQVQARPDLLTHVQRQCEPVLRDLLDNAGR